MNPSLRLLSLAGLVCATAVTALADIERTVERSFPVTGAGLLRVETYGGSIRVTSTSAASVTVVARQKIRAKTDAEADEILQKLELQIEQAGNDVTATAKYANRPMGFRFGSWPPVQVEFVVTVPAAYATDVKTSGGGITIGDLQGNVTARTSGGSIKLGNLGGEVDARTSGGNVSLASARGPVTLRTSGGDISTGKVGAKAELHTSGGNIRIDGVEHGLVAQTSGGNIRATLTGALREACTLDTSGGNVRVDVPKTAAFHLDASASGGGVDVEGLAVTISKTSRTRLVGDVNGGGPLLKLRTSGGGVSVRAN